VGAEARFIVQLSYHCWAVRRLNISSQNPATIP
jgi:hypothetical protein